MNASKGSRASTAELSRKSADGSEVKEVSGEEDMKEDQPENPENNGEKYQEENTTQEQENLPKDDTTSSGKSSPKQTTPTVDAETNQTMEDPINAETNAPVEAIPIGKEDMPKEESKGEEKKDKIEEKESLTVDLPPEEGKGGSPSAEDKEPSSSESQNHPSPPPHSDTPRPPPENDNESVEPLLEKTTVTPPESQPGLDSETRTRTPSSPDGKNDSAISSSSLSPEQERADSGMDERQGTPVIEVA